MTREILPYRLPSLTINFQFGGIKHYGRASWRADTRLAQVFIDTWKVGSAHQAMVNDLAKCASLALRHGCPEPTLRAALTRDDNGGPATPLGHMLDILAELAP